MKPHSSRWCIRRRITEEQLEIQMVTASKPVSCTPVNEFQERSRGRNGIQWVTLGGMYFMGFAPTASQSYATSRHIN